MGRMFGTDGVRGIANKELTCELAMKIGAAGAYALASTVHKARILVGQDTRRSSDMLSRALAAGICSVGGDVIDCGVIPTPAIAYLARLYEADAAVMISASHNTYEYNGIKWFNGEGYKLSDELEDEIENIVKGARELSRPVGAGVGHCVEARRAIEEYEEFLISAATARYDGKHIVLDCANGASSRIARNVFTALGATVTAYGDGPDGYNINDLCGSTHPGRLQELVAELGGDAGFAFDGDADRVIACDELGNIVDGDKIMGICARHLKENGRLASDTLVLTVMSNLGLKKHMRDIGVAVEETAVGDRYVMERMREKGYVLGGEQSGHIIFLDLNTTGDGILTAIQVMNILCEKNERMSRLAAEVPIYPQVLVNVVLDAKDKEAALADSELKARIEKAQAELADEGRVLVRASGTEPLIRIMLEGRSEEKIRRLALDMAKILEEKYAGRIRQ